MIWKGTRRWKSKTIVRWAYYKPENRFFYNFLPQNLFTLKLLSRPREKTSAHAVLFAASQLCKTFSIHQIPWRGDIEAKRVQWSAVVSWSVGSFFLFLPMMIRASGLVKNLTVIIIFFSFFHLCLLESEYKKVKLVLGRKAVFCRHFCWDAAEVIHQ